MAPSKKTMLFVCFLVAVAAVVVVPAVAQGGAGVLDPLFSKLLAIRGILYCSFNLRATVGPSGIIVTPPLSNVTMQLRCGPAGNGTVISTSITSSKGEFLFFLNKFTFPVTKLVDECRLMVATPIAKCNASTLPSVGALTSNLIPNGTITLGFVRDVPVLTATGFHCVALTG